MQVTLLPELSDPHAMATPNETNRVFKEHSYSKNTTYPLTQTTRRYIVGDRFHDGPYHSGHKKKTCAFHNMRFCPELTKFQSVTSGVINSKIKSVRLKSSSQQNATHYYFYNRLVDYWHNLDIVHKQYEELKKKIHPGEEISRDSLYSFISTQSCIHPLQ